MKKLLPIGMLIVGFVFGQVEHRPPHNAQTQTLDRDVPTSIHYQGNLVDADGEPISGEVEMNFRLFDNSNGGNQLWEQTTATGGDTDWTESGGNVDNYVVDVQFKDTQGYSGIHNVNYGLDIYGQDYNRLKGGYWSNLSETEILVYRALDDEKIHQFRVRIWICN